MPDTTVDFLFVHVPKAANYYKPIDEFLFINYVPMGVFGLCDLLDRQGLCARMMRLGSKSVVDPESSIAKYVREHGIRAVGMSLHWHYQSYDVIDVARKIKSASPDTKIFLGGVAASRFAQEIMETWSCIDCVVTGYGQIGTLAVARALISPTWFWGEKWELYRDYFKMPLFWSIHAPSEENARRKVSGATALAYLRLRWAVPFEAVEKIAKGRDAGYLGEGQGNAEAPDQMHAQAKHPKRVHTEVVVDVGRAKDGLGSGAEKLGHRAPEGFETQRLHRRIPPRKKVDDDVRNGRGHTLSEVFVGFHNNGLR